MFEDSRLAQVVAEGSWHFLRINRSVNGSIRRGPRCLIHPTTPSSGVPPSKYPCRHISHSKLPQENSSTCSSHEIYGRPIDSSSQDCHLHKQRDEQSRLLGTRVPTAGVGGVPGLFKYKRPLFSLTGNHRSAKVTSAISYDSENTVIAKASIHLDKSLFSICLAAIKQDKEHKQLDPNLCPSQASSTPSRVHYTVCRANMP